MQVVILGAGKVGFSLAELLSNEGHDVYVIEKEQERADIVNEKLNVQVIVGNGASPALQKQLNMGEADLLVAVTDSDEVNMLACMFAKQIGTNKTVARVRNIDYAMDNDLKKNPRLDIDLYINPEQVMANVITDHIRVPEALSINYFDEKQAVLIELHVSNTSPLIDIPIKDIKTRHPFLVVAIIRNQKMILPSGNDCIEKHDNIFIMAKTNEMLEVEQDLGFHRKKVEKIAIMGGGRLGYYLAENLEPTDIRVKVIEKSYARCEDLADKLESTIILNGDVADIDLLQEEGIENVDVLVGSTEDDKLNVLVCLLGSRLGAKKTIAQIRRSDYLPLIESVGIDVAVSPRYLTSEAILRFVRKGHLHSVAIIETGSAEIVDFYVEEDHNQLVNKRIADINFPEGVIITSILRDSEVIIPKGNDILQVNDRVSIFVTKGKMRKVEKMIK